MYALKLAQDGRILHATKPEFATKDHVMVEVLPEGNIGDYRYVDDGYIHDPLPKEETQAEPTTEEILNALLGVTE